MNPIQRAGFETEIAQATSLMAKGHLAEAFTHIERAHVIGQACVTPHIRSHWLMLKVECRRRRPVAAFGQVMRIFLGALGSAVGTVPVGNTGGSNISMFTRMPIDAELRDIIDGRSPMDRPQV